MIAKISSSANLAGALGYNFKKVDAGGASVLLTEGLYENPSAAYTLLEVLSDMQALGYGSQPYIVFKHHDIEREHIKMRISRTPKGTPQIVSVQSRILPNERIMYLCT